MTTRDVSGNLNFLFCCYFSHLCTITQWNIQVRCNFQYKNNSYCPDWYWFSISVRLQRTNIMSAACTFIRVCKREVKYFSSPLLIWMHWKSCELFCVFLGVNLYKRLENVVNSDANITGDVENTDCSTGHVDTDLSQGATLVVTVDTAYSGLFNRLISSQFWTYPRTPTTV